jgi:hypothetical protein
VKKVRARVGSYFGALPPNSTSAATEGQIVSEHDHPHSLVLLHLLYKQGAAMAGTCKEMSKIKQVLRFHEDGFKNRAIGRKLGINKETVNKYVKLAKANPLGLDRLLEMDDPVLECILRVENPVFRTLDFRYFGQVTVICLQRWRNGARHMSLCSCSGRNTRRTTPMVTDIRSSVSITINMLKIRAFRLF